VAKFLEGKESQQAIKNIFSEIDTNKDGTISKLEFLNLFLKEKLSKL
jgi:Ca2+-binding EF-hand superfamily protein